MALINCSECGNRVSEYASMCPVCGNPIEKKRYCSVCNNEIEKDSAFCRKCGTRVAPPHVHANMPPQMPQRPVQVPVQPERNVSEEEPSSNGVGTAGMVLSICGASFMTLAGMIEDEGSAVVGVILFIPAFILSFIGVFRRPRAKAVVGLVISAVVFSIFLLAMEGLSSISDDFIL